MHVHVHAHVVQCMRSACAVHVQSSQCVTTEPTTLYAGHDRGGALCGAGQQAAAVPLGPGAARHEILRPQARQTNVHPEVPGCRLPMPYLFTGTVSIKWVGTFTALQEDRDTFRSSRAS